MSIEGPATRARPDRWPVIRYVGGIVIGVVVLTILVAQRGDLVAAWRQLHHLAWPWAVGAVAAEFTSILTYAVLQRRVLVIADTDIGVARLVAISLANNAIANTVPGEPAVSSAFRYRQYRRRGASAAASGWTILTVIIAQAVGLSCLILAGVVVAIVSGPHGRLTGAAVVALVVVVAAGAVLVRRDLLLRFLTALVRVAQRVSGHPRGDLAQRVTSTLHRMREIELGPAATVAIASLGAITWFFDFACLLCAFAAVDAPIPRDGVLLAYGVAQIVAVLPIVPGGLGLVEGSLAVILVAYGSTRVPALSTVLIYRFVSYWLAVAVGWATFALLVSDRRRMRTDAPPPSSLQR